MTPASARLVTVKEGAPLEEAMRLMHKHRLERVLVVNGDFSTCAVLITVKDILKSSEHPKRMQGRVGADCAFGAAIGVGEGTRRARPPTLVEAGVDVLVVDTRARPRPRACSTGFKWVKTQFSRRSR